MKLSSSLVIIIVSLGTVFAEFTDPQCQDRQVIVQLFEWSWNAVANECEQVLGPKGFCGVQVSPPNEHIQGGEWWTRYQPVSYQLTSRSGNRQEFINMVSRCNAVGVNVIVDLVINHMSSHNSVGTGVGGTYFDGISQDYPAVPFLSDDFHQPYCDINDYGNVNEVRNCYLVSLNDINHSREYVQDIIAAYINDLIDIGVKGFRVDAAKHMWPNDLQAILSKVDNSPFFFHEVITEAGEPIQASEYFHLGKVTEFNAGRWINCLSNGPLDCLNGFGDGLTDAFHAVVFVDNHDTQRSGGVLTYKNDYIYKMGVGFLLAHVYGFKRIMSSYAFDDFDQGPPASSSDPDCSTNEWICEHRWSSIMNMVQFANAVVGTDMKNYQIKENSLGFSRGDRGFFAMGDLNNVEFFTGLPDGEYCDIIHDCQQKIQVVNGSAKFNKAQNNDPIVAICIGCK